MSNIPLHKLFGFETDDPEQIVFIDDGGNEIDLADVAAYIATETESLRNALAASENTIRRLDSQIDELMQAQQAEEYQK